MSKFKMQPRLSRTLVPGGDLGLLTNMQALKEDIQKRKPKDRRKMIAFLCAFYSTRKLTEILGVKSSYIAWACKENREIMESAHLSRNFSIADLAERKTVDIINHIDPERMSNDKRPQAAKYLMEVAELATNQFAPKEEKDDGNSMELIFRIKGKMKQNDDQKQIEENVPIDVEAKVIEEKK